MVRAEGFEPPLFLLPKQAPYQARRRSDKTGAGCRPRTRDLLLTRQALLPSELSRHIKNGGGDRNRTRDILLAKQTLSQLSYTPMFRGSLDWTRTSAGRINSALPYQLGYQGTDQRKRTHRIGSAFVDQLGGACESRTHVVQVKSLLPCHSAKAPCCIAIRAARRKAFLLLRCSPAFLNRAAATKGFRGAMLFRFMITTP